MQKLKKLLHGPVGRYLITGVSIYLLELLVIVVAQAMGATSLLAVALSFWIGLVVSFIIQKFFTFGDKRTHHKVVFVQAAAVVALVCFNFGFTLLVTKLLQDHLSPTITRTLALGTTTIWNFYLYKTRIFKQTEPQEIVY